MIGLTLKEDEFVWILMCFQSPSDEFDAKHGYAAAFATRVSLFDGRAESTTYLPAGTSPSTTANSTPSSPTNSSPSPSSSSASPPPSPTPYLSPSPSPFSSSFSPSADIRSSASVASFSLLLLSFLFLVALDLLL